MSQVRLGRPKSLGHRAKIGLGVTRYLSEHHGPWRDTKPELAFEQLLLEAHIAYEKQKQIGRMSVDFYLPDFAQVVEIDGCYIHSCPIHQPDGRHPDNFSQRAEQLKQLGYYAVRVWEHELIERF